MTSDRPLAYSYVRMSSPEQLKGHSLRRQVQITRDLAAKYNLELADENELQDLGVSAYRGANVTEGALGRFLEAVKRSQVPKGSYLLLELLDRFSRQKPLVAAYALLGIVCAGINVCTKDRKLEGPDVTQEDLMHVVFDLCRAHEESVQKARWISESWEDKRRQARESLTPVKGPCPAWLELDKSKNCYEVIPERAATVRLIFTESVSGIGGHALEQRMNARKIPNISQRSGHWHRSYIEKILTNKAVIGEYQPHRISNGKRVPVGKPIKNYFPAIVDEKLFYRVQECRADRLIRRRGRKGQYLTNLFTGLAACAYCGAPMRLENKGPLPKGGRFLACSAAKRGLGCVTTGWPYVQFEKSFLAFVREIELSKTLNSHSAEEDTAEQLIQTFLGKERVKKDQLARYLQLFETAPEVNYSDVANRLNEIREELQQIQQEIEKLRAQISRRDNTALAFSESLTEINPLIEQVQNPAADGDAYGTRSRLSERIRAIVARLQIGAAGTKPLIKGETTKIRISSLDGDTKKLFLQGLQVMENERFFVVTFRDGTRKQVNLKKDEPLRYISITDTD